MFRRLISFSIGFLMAMASFSQSVELIRNSPDFLWGEGVGSNVRNAQAEAMAMLSEQICVSVQSEFSLISQELQASGKSKSRSEANEPFEQVVKKVVRTYSRTTINTIEKPIVWGKEPNVHVLCYIKRSDLPKIFEQRREKLFDFVRQGIKSEQEYAVGDALQHFYWGMGLLRSLPDGGGLKMMINGTETNLLNWLRLRINTLLQEVRFSIDKKELDNELIPLEITYKGQVVKNCDFEYNLGTNWSETVAARNGVATLETFGQKINPRLLKIRVNVAFENQWNIDPEIKEVLEELEPVEFEKRFMGVTLLNRSIRPAVEEIPKRIDQQSVAEPLGKVQRVAEVSDTSAYLSLMQRVEQGIALRNYSSIRDCFTGEGWLTFQALIGSGEARIIGKPTYKFVAFEDGVICRSIPMQFKFRTNNKVIIQEVVFNLNRSEPKIRSLSFALSQPEINKIAKSTQWNEAARLTIIDFLEHYQTAYALKRIGFLEEIFDDNALIIVGNVTKRKQVTAEGGGYSLSPIVRTNRYSKQEYLQKLRSVFLSNEYINLKFNDITVRESEQYANVFGIRLKQDYYSSRYGDTGHLFLLVDLRQPHTPTIHVRVWQNEKDPQFGYADLELFL